MTLSGKITGSYRGYTLEVSWTANQSIVGNYSDITCVHRLICDSTYALYISEKTNSCSVDGTTKTYTSAAINTGGGTTITLGTTTHRVNHNTDGTKSCTISSTFKIQADIVGTYVEEIKASGTITLNQIPRQAAITGANNFTDEENPALSYSNIGGYQITTAYLSFGTSTITRSNIGNAASGSYKFELTEAERNILRNATPNSNTMSVTYGLKTNINGSVFVSEMTKTLTIVNANPSTPTLAYQDTNSTTIAITGDNQRIIRNKSTLRAIIGSSVAKKGATIKTYETTINGVKKQGNGNVDFGALNIATSSDLVLVVTDSRGNKVEVKKTVIIDNWEDPTASIQLSRINNFETSTNLKVDSTYSSLNSKNAITCEYCYKKTTDTNYSSWIAVADKTLITISLDNTYEYNVQVRIKDKLSSYVIYKYSVPKGKPLFYIDTNLFSVGVNTIPEVPNTFGVDGNINATGSMSIDGTGSVVGNFFANGNRVYGMEKGTWTPKLSCVSGETAPTYTVSIIRGNYKKFGPLVFVSFMIRGKITALNGTNNYACITGLPFTPKDYNMGEQSFGIGILYGVTNNDNNMIMGINDGAIRIQSGYGAGASAWKITTTSYFEIGASGWYETE